jgi:hypothetical protein
VLRNKYRAEVEKNAGGAALSEHSLAPDHVLLGNRGSTVYV